jgi:hypothetical protein
MQDWEIARPLGECSATGRQIAPGEEYYAALVETPEGFRRMDYCADYWEKNQPGVYCYWKSRYPQEGGKKRVFIDDEMLMGFFDRLEGENEPGKLNFRFVLAMVLMRKKKLKYDSSRSESDDEIWRLRVTGADRFVDVLNPHLGEEQIEELTSQIGEILQADP